MAKRNTPLLEESLSILIPAFNEEGNIERVTKMALNDVKNLLMIMKL
jgi:hypothetical protein